MSRKIAWNDIPKWTQEAIKKAGLFGTSQVSRDGESLSVQFGKARFNGVEVAKKGEEVNPDDTTEETMLQSELPLWAQADVRRTRKGSSLQKNISGDSLQIVPNGKVTYNGKTVKRD